MATAVITTRAMSPVDARIVDQFLDDAERLSRNDWKIICQRRAAMKRQIRNADEALSYMLIAFLRSTRKSRKIPRQEQAGRAINERALAIAQRFPEKARWDHAEHRFREHIHLALAQALMPLRKFSVYTEQPGGPEAARVLTAAFEGFVRLPPIPATPPAKTAGKTRAAKSKRMAARPALPRQRPYRLKPGDEVIESSLTLDSILAGALGPSRQDRERLMQQLLEWANASAWLRSTPIAKLKEPVRMVRVLYWFRADAIVEGVWHFLFESWGARDHWEFLRRSCQTIRADGVLRCLDAVDALFPKGIPRTEAAMEKAMSALRDQDPDPLNEIDRKYQHVIDEEIPTRLHAYLKAHRATAESARLP